MKQNFTNNRDLIKINFKTKRGDIKGGKKLQQ